jgi:hypothetical protein
MDRHRFDADQDPTFQFDADPDQDQHPDPDSSLSFTMLENKFLYYFTAVPGYNVLSFTSAS